VQTEGSERRTLHRSAVRKRYTAESATEGIATIPMNDIRKIKQFVVGIKEKKKK